MDPREKPEKRQYVVLVFLDVDPKYYTFKSEKRAALTEPHIDALTEHLETVSLLSLKGTGLAQDVMIEVLQSESLTDIERMMDTCKAGAKSRYGRVRDVIVTERGMMREMTGARAMGAAPA